jgi:hypothetical protein
MVNERNTNKRLLYVKLRLQSALFVIRERWKQQHHAPVTLRLKMLLQCAVNGLKG